VCRFRPLTSSGRGWLSGDLPAGSPFRFEGGNMDLEDESPALGRYPVQPPAIEMVRGLSTLRRWLREAVCLFRGHDPYPVYCYSSWLFTQCRRCHKVGE
jgi:hypothetical protein